MFVDDPIRTKTNRRRRSVSVGVSGRVDVDAGDRVDDRVSRSSDPESRRSQRRGSRESGGVYAPRGPLCRWRSTFNIQRGEGRGAWGVDDFGVVVSNQRGVGRLGRSALTWTPHAPLPRCSEEEGVGEGVGRPTPP